MGRDPAGGRLARVGAGSKALDLLGLRRAQDVLADKRRFVRLRHSGFRIARDTQLYVDRDTKLQVGTGCKVAKGVVLMLYRGQLVIGDDATLGDYCNIRAFASFIRLGNHVGIGQFTSIVASNHEVSPTGVWDTELAVVEEGRHGVVIGDDCWIGAHCVILPGVTIGDRCVVGAGSVVSRDVPSGSTVAGVPARVIKRRESREPAKRSALR
jgi:acetyltransferase-like isoleucine patch superfamily enzyme